jgi:sulfoxide reductase heme-binding subunit YedZ
MSKSAMVWLKVAVHLALLGPLVYLLRQYQDGQLALQPDPVNTITHFTGDWALWILLGDLAITPVRRLHASLAWLVRFRRMVGLYAFFYATLHLATYIFLFSGYDTATAIAGLRAGYLGEPFHQFALAWPGILDDLKKRVFIQIGLVAWFTLFLLAITSPQRVLRWMGGRSWQTLHRLIYGAAALAVIHFWWSVKAGVRRPLPDTLVLAVLLLARLVFWLWKRKRTPARGTVGTAEV